MSDPFAIIRAAAGDPPASGPASIITPADLFTGSEPVMVSAPIAPESPLPVAPITENVLEAALLDLNDRVRLLETLAKRNGWNV